MTEWVDVEEENRVSTENASERVIVRASPELLAEMRNKWSRPVEVKATQDERGEWQFIFRYAEPASPPEPGERK